MERDLTRLASRSFDVVVVGGGILGAFVSLFSARRGLRTALVERRDFGSGTTSRSGKVLHGGIRYLQDLQVSLAREAHREQKMLADMAPGLVRPLPFFVPARKDHLRENALLRGGAIGWKAFRRFSPEDSDLPASRFLTDSEAQRLTGELSEAVSGGLLFYDYQLRSPERFTFEVVRTASDLGATAVNYAEALDLHVESGRISGIRVRDRLDGQTINVDCDRVVNATGVWGPDLLRDVDPEFPDVAFGKGIHVVVERPEPPAALALPFAGRESDEPTGSGERRVFLMPWEGRTLIGASYAPFQGSPGEVRARGSEIRSFLSRLSSQWPGLSLSASRILYAYAGLYPVFGRKRIPDGRFEASLHPLIVNHGATRGPKGLVTALSVKMTTARSVAERVMGIMLGSESDEPEALPVVSGPTLSRESSWEALGSAAELLDVAARAVRTEMAQTLEDVLLRRSWIGQKAQPAQGSLEEAAAVMGKYLGWSARERHQQVARVEARYERMGSGKRVNPDGRAPTTAVDGSTSSQ